MGEVVLKEVKSIVCLDTSGIEVYTHSGNC